MPKKGNSFVRKVVYKMREDVNIDAYEDLMIKPVLEKPTTAKVTRCSKKKLGWEKKDSTFHGKLAGGENVSCCPVVSGH